jgi:ketosteroid isomerase-like protein
MPLAATISRFIEASNARNLAAAVACFAADAVVEDEGETHRGLAAVRAWKKATEDRFRYTIEPTRVERRSESVTVVTATLAGDFPGSPVELKYEFTMRDDAIEALRIHQ